jgi:MEDS: MEthanogen/methylotroph, DcmR Sensory domain
MRKTGGVGSATRPEFVHEALVYSSDEELLARVVPFIGEGLRAGDPALVVVPPAKIGLLQAALGLDAAKVKFMDATRFYGRPATTVAAYRKVVDEHAGERLRVVGEVQFGDTVSEHAAWTRYESILNACFGGEPVWIICPYDRRELPDHVVTYASRTHEFLSNGGEHEASTAYLHPDELVARPASAAGPADLSEPIDRIGVHDEADVGRASLAVARAAREAGLDPHTVADITVVVSELVRDALPSGVAEVLVFHEGREWICDVVVPAPASHVGVSIARLVGQGIELFTEPDRDTVRLRFTAAG